VVCRLAVERTGLTHPIVDGALNELEADLSSDASIKSQLEHLTEDLDKIQWDLQGDVDRGKAEHESYMAAFSRARAANALWHAFWEDPFVSAVEAAYEAHAAIGDLVVIERLVEAILEQGS